MKKIIIILICILVIAFVVFFIKNKKRPVEFIPISQNAFEKYDSSIKDLEKSGGKVDISLSKCVNSNEEIYVVTESIGVASNAYYFDKDGHNIANGYADDVPESGSSGRKINLNSYNCTLIKKNN